MSKNYDTVLVTFERDKGDVSTYTAMASDQTYWSDHVGVRKCYQYKAPKGMYQEGDQAVVDSPYGAAVVSIRLVNPKGIRLYSGLTKWLVCKVDRSLANRRQVLANDIAQARVEIEETVDELFSLRKLEIACLVSPGLCEIVERLGNLTTELESLGGC